MPNEALVAVPVLPESPWTFAGLIEPTRLRFSAANTKPEQDCCLHTVEQLLGREQMTAKTRLTFNHIDSIIVSPSPPLWALNHFQKYLFLSTGIKIAIALIPGCPSQPAYSACSLPVELHCMPLSPAPNSFDVCFSLLQGQGQEGGGGGREMEEVETGQIRALGRITSTSVHLSPHKLSSPCFEQVNVHLVEHTIKVHVPWYSSRQSHLACR